MDHIDIEGIVKRHVKHNGIERTEDLIKEEYKYSPKIMKLMLVNLYINYNFGKDELKKLINS